MQYDPALDPDGTKAAAEAERTARKEMMASMPGMVDDVDVQSILSSLKKK